ncbi:MAG: LytTR family transcriptional regulator [Bacteroidetes bacterium]|nr:LytTR family transcriptional regulator [Bacteroidota bacterium]
MEKHEPKQNILKAELARLFFIAVGIFLFVLFFQPFPLDKLSYDNRLLYVTGFGAITFILSFLVLMLIPLLFPKWFKLSQWESGSMFFLNIVLLVLSITAYSFYVMHVGHSQLTLYVIFKISLVCLMPVIILSILYKNKSLESIIEILQRQNKLFLARIDKLEENGKDQQVTIYSDSKTDKIALRFKDIIWVRSADNYIEMHYLVNDVPEKKLIRNTLKNIEIQLAERPEFIRCHRTSIVNISYSEKIVRNYSGFSLKMNYLDQNIPISRQYLVLIKDAIAAKE